MVFTPHISGYWLNVFPRGKIVLCVLPVNDLDPLHAVKWHPQEPDYVAVASETNVYFVNIADALHVFGGEPIPQSELQRVGQIFSVPSVSTQNVMFCICSKMLPVADYRL